MQTFDQEKIRDRAYQLWDRAGQPEGREEEFWYEAERELAENQDVDSSAAAADIEASRVVPGRLS